MKLFRRGTDATPGDGTEASSAPSARQSSNLVPAMVIAVGLIVGGFLLRGGSAPSEAAAAPHSEPAKVGQATEEATHGPVQNLDPITLNLADGHFLKVGIALQLADVEGGGHEAEELPSAKALDIAIAHLGSHTMDELASPSKRELVKKKLSNQVAKAYVDPETHTSLVTKVYFTEFVMQ